MKIYTKKGDQGFTGLLGRSKVLKSNIRIEAYGTVDELNSQLGLLASLDESIPYLPVIFRIQGCLLTIGAILSAVSGKVKIRIPALRNSETRYLEARIDAYDKVLPKLKSFILPGGNTAAAQCHIARCVCRRAERRIVAITREEEVPSAVIIYMNRLSDFLFMLARKLAHDGGYEEKIWESA